MTHTKGISPKRVFLLAALSVLGGSASAQVIRVDGVSAGSGILRLAAAEFGRERNGKGAARVSLTISGDALGKLCRGEVDISSSDRPILKEESARCAKAHVEFIEVPIALDAITVVVNARNRFVSTFSVEDLRKMWEAGAQGKVVRWSQVSERFPQAPLKLLGPDTRIEQSNAFTETVLGRGQRSRRDYSASAEDFLLVQGIARDVNTLGYISYQAYAENRTKLRAVPITFGGREAIRPSPETIANGAYAALSRPLILYLSLASVSEKPQVRDFAEFALTNGPALARDAGCPSLTEAAYQIGLAHLRSRRTGTAWDGAIPMGVTPREVERRLASL
jgi:phosphate transport system substrate-binding protein